MSSNSTTVDLLSDFDPLREAPTLSQTSHGNDESPAPMVLVEGRNGLVVAQDVPTNESLQQGVYNIKEVRRSRKFVEKLHDGLEPSNVTLAKKIENVVGKSLASVLRLKTSLPDLLQSLLADVQQVRDVEGKRVVDIIERSGLTDCDVENVQKNIFQIQKHIFGSKMNDLLKMVKDCEAEFRKTEGGYDQCMHEQEANLCRIYNMTKYIKYVYTPLNIIVAPPDLLLAGSIGILFATFVSMKHRSGLASLVLGVAGLAKAATLSTKLWSLGLRSDFDQIQIEKKEHLSEVRQIRSMGQQMGNHLKTIQDDIQRLQACQTRFEHLKDQLPNYQASSLDAACLNAKMLHQVLIERDLEEAAAVLLMKNISGRAFLEVLSGKEDLEALGITDQLTLRRLMNLQDEWKSGNGKVLLNAHDFGRSLMQAMDEVIDGIRKLENKYCK